MNVGIELITNNLGMSFENILLLIFALGCIIIMAKSYLIGLMLFFFGNGILFIWFYYAGYNYQNVIIAMFVSIVLLALNLWAVSNEGGGVLN